MGQHRKELILVTVRLLQGQLDPRALGDLVLQRRDSPDSSSVLARCSTRFSISSSRVFSACNVVLASARRSFAWPACG